MTSTTTTLHVDANSSVPVANRISTRHYNYNTWATAAVSIDEHEVTVFLHSVDSIREYASKLAGLSHALFLIANEQEIVARAKEQAALVG